MLEIGVIGYGHFGPNLARCLRATPGVKVACIADRSEEQLARALSAVPDIWTTTDPLEVIAAPRVDAVVVATPAATHFELALAALRHGKHVLVEKPIATRASDACCLIDEAASRRRVLMVDHTFVYTAAVRKMQEIVREGIGELLYYDSVRANLGRIQPDVDVLWDLAVHDLAIIDQVVPLRPRAVSAVGGHLSGGRRVPLADLSLAFDGPLVARVHVSWLASLKTRRTVLGGSDRTIVYDDLEPRAKIRVHDVEPVAGALGQKAGARRAAPVSEPKLDGTEPLLAVTRHFARCVETGARPWSDGLAGLSTVRVLEAADRSMAEGGRFVPLSAAGVGF